MATMKAAFFMLKEQSVIFSSCCSIMNGQHGYELAIAMLASGRTPLQQIVPTSIRWKRSGRGLQRRITKRRAPSRCKFTSRRANAA
jgi:hypothetical protein